MLDDVKSNLRGEQVEGDWDADSVVVQNVAEQDLRSRLARTRPNSVDLEMSITREISRHPQSARVRDLR